MRRLISLLLGSAAVAAAVRLVARRRADRSPSEPNVMPRPTAAAAGAPTAPGEAGQPSARTVSEEEPMREEPDQQSSSPEETPGPIPEGEPGAITAAPVPEEPAPEPSPAPPDSELERAVEAEIGEDPAVPVEGVEVDVEGRVARLTGSVPDDDTATRVGDDAARVDGIIGLDDKLERGADTSGEPTPSESRGEPGDAEPQPRIPGSDPGATRRPVDSPE